ncbi:cytoplasmic 60S subunit biogenesis factor ZNF622 [Planococcus citri]|uniref:cytoplasmic 60S subunit biogenesis factor ZNF622 n=1 Tax=Planococcus citri TaxID=170843 RepID=UPI0031F82054
MSSPFTCINCQVAFREAALQRDHYKTDWHRYNLKRKIAELPPVTAEEFQRRVTILKLENETKSNGKNYTYCTACKKSFASSQSFDNHLQSKKHIELAQLKNGDYQDDIAQPSIKTNKLVEKMEIPPSEQDDDEESLETASSGTEELDSDEWEEIISEDNPILNNDCLFCNHHSASLTKNVKHMSIEHSFFIPHIEYLADLKGLLLYLGEKISQGFMCIGCNDKKSSFVNIEAVRNHMLDKGHAKIPTDTESSLEYVDFYDFEHGYDDDDYDDEAEEDDDCKSIASVVTNTGKTVSTDGDSVTMALPSGEVICHRSLIRYFRQNPIIARKKLPHVKETKIQKLINHYRVLGWSPTQKEQIKKKVKDIKYINFIQSKYETKLRVKANKLQTHFRQQVDF